eukprot:9309150-Pyramimonas_sp.AAC.1
MMMMLAMVVAMTTMKTARPMMAPMLMTTMTMMMSMGWYESDWLMMAAVAAIENGDDHGDTMSIMRAMVRKCARAAIQG